MTLRIQRVRDRSDGSTWSPLVAALRLRRRKYTPDLRTICVEEATRTSYGEAEEAIRRAVGVRVPRRSIWNMAQELAVSVRRAHQQIHRTGENPVYLADSTEVRSQIRRGHHQVHVAVSQAAEGARVEVVGIRVNGTPSEVLEGVPAERLVTDDDPSLRSVGVERHQLCVRHFQKAVWQALFRSDRRLTRWGRRGLHVEVRERLGGIFGALVASVRKHQQVRGSEALRSRISATLSELAQMADDLESKGYDEAARFVRTRARSTVVFAEMALEGVWAPATSNSVERIMGMIADRCKRKWAHWGRGLENMVYLLLVRKTRPAVYRWAERRYMRG